MPGKPSRTVAQATDDDLAQWIGRLESDRHAGKWKPQYAEKNAAQLEAMLAESKRRQPRAPGAPPVDDGRLPPDQEPPDDYDRGDDPERY